jgi:hypothetical protein
MFGSRMLEVFIGTVFVFLLVSIICSTIREVLEARFKTRAAYLEQGIRQLLHDSGGAGLTTAVYMHPLIDGLFTGSYIPTTVTKPQRLLAKGSELPSYIPSRNFALALMDIAARGPITDAISGDPDGPSLTIDAMRRGVVALENPAVQRIVLGAIDTARGDIDRVQAALEAWFDSGMDRVSGWYKRSTSWIVFWIGLAVALLLNINTLTIVDYLYRNDAARSVVVAQATAAAKDSTILNRSYTQARAALDSVQLPIGWDNGWQHPVTPTSGTIGALWNGWIYPALGLLLTALAATMGAPFWFDILNKASVVRSTVKPHEKSREEGSEDRKAPDDETAPVAAIAARPAVEQIALAPTVSTGSARGQNLLASRASPRDAASAEDGCDVPMAGTAAPVTADEELPPAIGGVA